MESTNHQSTVRLRRFSGISLVIGVLALSLVGSSAGVAADGSTKWSGPTTKVTPPKALKVAVIPCFSVLSGCVSPATGAKEAAKTLGWNVRVFDGGGSPDKQNAQMLNAIAWGAKVILNIAIDANAVQSGLRAAKKANVIVASGSNGVESPNPSIKPAAGSLGYAFDVGPNYAALGEATAKWIIKDSGGKANIVVYSDKEFPSVLAFQAGLLKGLDACPTCTQQPLQYFVGAQVGDVLNKSVVGFIQSHNDVNYVFLPFDPAAGSVVPAIAAAGLGTKVRLVSVLGSQQNLAFVRAGNVQVADAAYDNLYMGYAMLDQISRVLAKQPLSNPHGENLPFVVLDNANTPSDGTDWHAPFNYIAKFKALWGK